jgi:cytoskeleton protein RodZ
MIYGVHALAPDASPGRRLCYARKAMRLSQDDVARLLRLQIHIIQALEEDNFEKVPASLLYVRGYLRAYSRLVKIAEEEIIACYNNLNILIEPVLNISKPSLTAPKKRKLQRYGWCLGISCMAIALVAILLSIFWL